MFFGTTPPHGRTARFECVGAFVEYEGSLLFLKRDPTIMYGGRWGMPAGKIEPNETRADAMARELLEEAGLTIPVTDTRHFRDTVYVELPETGLFAFHLYHLPLCERPTVLLLPGENTEATWMTPREAREVKDTLFPDTDACIAHLFSL